MTFRDRAGGRRGARRRVRRAHRSGGQRARDRARRRAAGRAPSPACATSCRRTDRSRCISIRCAPTATRWLDASSARPRQPAAGDAAVGAPVGVPVCYGGELGPDLADVAAFARPDARTTSSRCTRRRPTASSCSGSCPGFAYLGSVDRADRGAAPRDAARARAGGSVGIAGGQTGIYPAETPGGWQLIGRTPRQAVRSRRAPSRSCCKAGDARAVLSDRRASRPCRASAACAARRTSIRPGMLTTVQDLGRWGYQARGVPVAGPMDPCLASAGERARRQRPRRGDARGHADRARSSSSRTSALVAVAGARVRR